MTAPPADALSDERLLPCPSCNGDLALHDNDWADPPLWHAYCQSCGLHFGETATKEKAIEVANRRSSGLDPFTVEACAKVAVAFAADHKIVTSPVPERW